MSSPLKIAFNGELISNSITRAGRKTILSYPCESNSVCNPYEVTFRKGLYQIDCWGAGYEDEYRVGYGAHTRGVIYFPFTQKLYLYLGGSFGRFNSMHPDANVSNGSPSSGATDVRIDRGEYYEFNSLKSRIMVAGGSGGSDNTDGEFGHGGTINGERGLGNFTRESKVSIPERIAPGGTQTSGGECTQTNCIQGGFGIAKSNPNSPDNGAYGGGGYYAGATYDGFGNGGGGSSFISGHEPCIAVDKESTADHIIPANNSLHYSGLRFYKTLMESGKVTLHNTRGKVEITVLLAEFTCRHQTPLKIYFISMLSLFFSK